jgi:serine phosphatase RsbU (regulator of sigma subunit)/anti-sigma regulatory factor (Ser/Thr protein kinase)
VTYAKGANALPPVSLKLTRFVGIMLLGVVLLGGSLAANQYRSGRNTVLAQISKDTQNSARSVEQILNSRIQTLLMLSATRTMKTQDRIGMKTQFDAVLREGNARPGSIGWLDYSDRLVVSTDRSRSETPVPVADRAYVQQVRLTRKPYISDGLRSRVTNDPIFVVAVPTTDDAGTVTGTLIWSIRLDDLDAALSTIIERNTLVLDRSGNVLFGLGVRTLSAPSAGFDRNRYRSRKSGLSVDTTSPTGQRKHIVAFATAPAGDWLVMKHVSMTEGLSGPRKLVGFQLGLLTLVSAALLWFGRRTQRELSRSALRQALSAQRSEALRILATDLTPAASQQDVRSVLLERGAGTVGASVVNVAVTDGYRPADQGDNIPMFVSSEVPKEVAIQWASLPMGFDSPMRDAYVSSTPVLLASQHEGSMRYPALVEASELAGVSASASYPLFDTQHQTVGVIGFAWDKPQTFDQFQRSTLDTVSRLAGQALERAALYDREQSARLQAEGLQQLTFDLVMAASVSDVAQIIALNSVVLFGANRATLSAQEVGKQTLSLCSSHGYEEHAIPPWATASSTDKAPTLDALRLQRSLLVRDLVSGDYAHHADHFHSRESSADSAWLAIPLPVEEFDPTVLVLEFSGPQLRHAINIADSASSGDFAARAALGLDRQRRIEQTNTAAEHSRQLAEAVTALATADSASQVGSSFAQSISPLLATGGVLAVFGQAPEHVELAHGSLNDSALDLTTLRENRGRLRAHALKGKPEFMSGAQSLNDLHPSDICPSLTLEMTFSIHAWSFLPLLAADRVIGFAIFFFSNHQVFDDEQRIEQTSYAALFANALARVERYEREHEVAVILQASLLPTIPDHIFNIELAGRYRPSTRNVSVGGDWFDAIPVSNGRVLLVVGDVVGHGIHSAAAMGKLAAATRTLAGVFPEPVELLRHLDTFAASDVDTRYASIALVVVDPIGGTLSSSTAGHPVPIAWGSSSGVAEIVSGRGPALGVNGAMRCQHQTILPDHTTLVMFTDGLTERRLEHIDSRLDQLAEVIVGHHESVAVLADQILSSMLESSHSDDVALLVSRLSFDAPVFECRISKVLSELQPMRFNLRNWLRRIGSTCETTEDILVAVGEAVTNAIEHGDQVDERPVFLHATRVRYQCVITIETFDDWVVPTEGIAKNESNPHLQRGRGLLLMQKLMDQVTIEAANGRIITSLTKALPQRLES